MKETINAYLRALGAGEYPDITALFSDDAVVISPLYGEMNAAAFFRKLLADTDHAVITPLRVYTDEEDRSGAAFFLYEWVMNDGRHISFEVVDLFNFDEKGKIAELRIIYDTAPVLKT